MIKILEQDTIVDVVNKINNCEDNEIILEFPFSHPILHNYMSLKILKSKSWTKRITIVTNDIISKKIWNSIWINYSIVKDSNYIKEKNIKQELLKHNFGFFEYLIYELKKYYSRFLVFIWKKTGINGLKYYNPYDKVKSSGALFLIIWLFTSLWMLLFIFYFAVNKTYIHISPEVKVKTDWVNIVYEENYIPTQETLNQDLKVWVKKVSENIDIEYTHKTTWIDYEKTSRSSWEVTVYNLLKDEQVFRPKTRLVNESWLVFETTDWIKIPWSSFMSWSLVPWTAKANIIARIYDNNWEFIWERWNLKSGTFLFPGLRFNQDKIYAKLEKPTKWWDNNIAYLVSQDDISNAKAFFEEQLKKEALEKLKQKIIDENSVNNIKYEILWVNDIINYSDLNITFKNNEVKVWEKIENFTLKWHITITTYIFNKNNVINILSWIINEKLLPWTDKLLFIDENTLRTSLVIERISKEPLKIKATTEINYWISFDFDNNANYSNQRLKTLILWLDNNSALNILLNDPNISNVKIKNTPFFIKRVSSNIDNIIMKITQ